MFLKVISEQNVCKTSCKGSDKDRRRFIRGLLGSEKDIFQGMIKSKLASEAAKEASFRRKERKRKYRKEQAAANGRTVPVRPKKSRKKDPVAGTADNLGRSKCFRRLFWKQFEFRRWFWRSNLPKPKKKQGAAEKQN